MSPAVPPVNWLQVVLVGAILPHDCWPIVADAVSWQVLASFTVIECEPAPRLGITSPDAQAENAPPSVLHVYGDSPPVIVTVMLPVVPWQVALVGDKASAGLGLILRFRSSVAVQLSAVVQVSRTTAVPGPVKVAVVAHRLESPNDTAGPETRDQLQLPLEQVPLRLKAIAPPVSHFS